MVNGFYGRQTKVIMDREDQKELEYKKKRKRR